jgi:hypothetical protein
LLSRPERKRAYELSGATNRQYAISNRNRQIEIYELVEKNITIYQEDITSKKELLQIKISAVRKNNQKAYAVN